MHQILALWTHPRSLSTALERVFIERGDFVVIHEPFSVLYYMLEQRANPVHAEFDGTEMANYSLIRDRIIETARRRAVCFKDMCYHCHDDLIKDARFLRSVTNVFLIRDPRQAIASHFAKNPNVTCEEIGYEKEASVFRRVWELTGNSPLVISAEDLQQDPAGTMSALCNRIGLAHRADVLTWQPGHFEQWDNWKQWHSEVAGSNGIYEGQTEYARTVDNDSRLGEYYEHHRPFYEEMKRQRLRTCARNTDGQRNG